MRRFEPSTWLNAAMRARPLPVLVLVALAVALVGGGAIARSATVVVRDGFDPDVLYVTVDTTVTWRNADDERHRVRSTDGPAEFDSGDLGPGESFAFRFTVEGRYRYVDERHEGEDREDDEGDRDGPVGTIIVSLAEVPTTDPAPEMGAPAGSEPAASVAPSATPSAAAAMPSAPSSSLPMAASPAPLERPSELTSVAIVDRAFEPASLTVAAGTTVEWTNRDDEGHTVTATDGSFDSGLMAGGMSFSMRFDSPGMHEYSCGIHPEMRGSVTVVAVAEPGGPAATPLPAASPSAATSASADQAGVIIAQTAYGPASLEVAAGTTVNWTNDDPIIHTVTARDGSFNSGVLQPGDEYSFVFEASGTYEYFCAVHPGQGGSIVVSDVPG
jgi:plastocyanin